MPLLVNDLPVFTPKEVITVGNTLVLVDLENYPQMALTNGFVYPNTDFIGFIGKCSSLAQHITTIKEKYNFMSIVVVDSVLNDAVDHFISMYYWLRADSCVATLRYKSVESEAGMLFL